MYVLAAFVFTMMATWLLVRWLAGPDAQFIDVATGVAAMGTFAAAVVVAWQAVMTRKAVQAAEDSADLARKAADISQELVAEAVKTRLDARAPSTSLVMLDAAQWPPYEPSDFGEAQQVRAAAHYNETRDANQRIQVRGYVELTNHWTKPLTLKLGNVVPTDWDQQASVPRTVKVPPGKEVGLFIIQTRTVAEWIAAYLDRQNSGASYDTHANIGFSDDMDEGVTDVWSAVIAGSPLRPVHGMAGTWEVLPNPSDDASGRQILQCVLLGMERIYFLSRRRNRVLNAPDASTPASTE